MGILSAYRNWVGLAKLTTTTTLTTKATSGGTSLKVASAAGITTSSTVVILDGGITETKAVSNVTGTTLTVTSLAHTHSRGAFVYALPTSTFGPTNWLAMRTYKVPDKYTQLYDVSRRGSMVTEVGVVQGMRASEWTFDGDVYGDTFGFILGGFFGAEDYSSGGATVPKSHAFAAKNTGNGQPTLYAFYVYDGVNVRTVVGRITKLGLKYTPKALLSWTATLTARASGVTSTFTASYSTYTVLPTWQTSLLLATTYTRIPLTFTLTLTRQEVENIPTMTGTQDPLDTFVGGIKCTFKGSYVKTGDTQLAKYTTGTQQKFLLTFVRGTGASQVAVAVQMSDANYDTVEPTLQGKAYNTEPFSGTGVATTTDATVASGGTSPVKITLKNTIATGKYV